MSAGLGSAAEAADSGRYEHQYAHCDVLVIGGGPAGVAAAGVAADAGARVILCQQSPTFGSKLIASSDAIDNCKASVWVDDALARLESNADVTVLSRTTAFGYYDDNLVAAHERVEASPGASA